MQLIQTTRRQIAQLATALTALALVGCTTSTPQGSHHFVAQDQVAGSSYREDIVACAEAAKKSNAYRIKFSAYEACMQERGYALVAARDTK